MTAVLDLSLVADRIVEMLDGTAVAAPGLPAADADAAAALAAVLDEDLYGEPAGRGDAIFSGTLPETVPDRALLVRVMEPPGGYVVDRASPTMLVGPIVQVVALVRSGRVGSVPRVLSRIHAAAHDALTDDAGGPVAIGAPGVLAPVLPLTLVSVPALPEPFGDDFLYTATRYTCGVARA